MKKYLLILCIMLTISCQAQETSFKTEALNDTFLTTDGTEVMFSEILEKHKGKTIFIDVWASWCKDCIVGMPKVKEIQEYNKEVAFVFLSLDRSEDAWKAGMAKYEVEGDNYFVPKGWKSPFCKSIDLDWIPRYMVVAPDGSISLFKAVKATDKKIKKALKGKLNN